MSDITQAGGKQTGLHISLREETGKTTIIRFDKVFSIQNDKNTRGCMITSIYGGTVVLAMSAEAAMRQLRDAVSFIKKEHPEFAEEMGRYICCLEMDVKCD
ncbi:MULTISPECIES: hypothetical protein [Serratia]|uniref:hypothetical protein n=1 Tax=Serratia TaxID=613 RepID=UPI000661521C|nr:hypothetical protein [Serratia sp. 506_PEND]